MRLLAVLLVASGALALSLPRIAAAAAAEKVSYKPPVDGPIVDPYRPPPEPWSAGNRGIDYAPAPGTPVKAAADGEVTFAGQVGGDLHVVILHADGVRTSYSFLDSIAVHRGDKVRQGQVIGTSGEDLHFGARVGDDYIDPRTLFDGPPQVFLVPDDVRKAGTESQERSGLTKFLGGIKKVVGLGVNKIGAAIGQKIDQLQDFKNSIKDFDWRPHAILLLNTVVAWWKQRSDCTPASVEPPPLPEQRIAVLVDGLGSKSRDSTVDDIETTEMGYLDSIRFSYNGGTVDQNSYDPRDTTQDLRLEARRLRELLEQVQRDHPGVPVDLIGHSQGGVIARAMLAYEYEANRARLPRVASLVTLASPHQGTDVATALKNIADTTSGNITEWAVSGLNITSVDLRGTSVRQLAENSDFLNDLNKRRLPDGINFTSIGSRGDLLVPGIHTTVKGAHNVLVNVTGWRSDHSQLPGSPEGQREVRLAVAGLAPTCQSIQDMVTDIVASDAIATGEDLAGDLVMSGADWVDDTVGEAVSGWLAGETP